MLDLHSGGGAGAVVPGIDRSIAKRVLALVLALVVMVPSGVLGADSSPSPAGDTSASPAVDAAGAACRSADNLRLIIEYLRAVDPAQDGWLPVFVGVVAGLSEGQELAGLVGVVYRPLVEDLIVSLQGLRDTVNELRQLGSTGARLATIGESITSIGVAMDALSMQLREPCPNEP